MFPRWVSWVFLLFLAYIIFTGNHAAWKQREAQQTPPGDIPAAEGKKEYPEIRAFTDRDRWMKGINPEYVSPDEACAAPRKEGELLNFGIMETSGSGVVSSCGDTIAVKIVLWKSDGKPAETIERQDVTLGEQKGLDALLLGMGEGETRQIVVTVPADGYAAIPAMKKASVQLATITRLGAEIPSETTETPPQEAPSETTADTQ